MCPYAALPSLYLPPTGGDDALACATKFEVATYWRTWGARLRLPGTRVATLELQAPSAAVGPLKQDERGRGSGRRRRRRKRAQKWVALQKFSVARCCVFCEVARSLLEFAQWRHLSFFLFFFYSFLFSVVETSKSIEGTGADWGWSELFGSRTMVQELLAKQKAF